MALVLAVFLAVLVLHGVWEWLVVLLGGAIEIGEAAFRWRWSHGRRAVVGAEALIGRVVMIDDDGWARVHGERWQVRGAGPGERLRVDAVDGLTLVGERLL